MYTSVVSGYRWDGGGGLCEGGIGKEQCTHRFLGMTDGGSGGCVRAVYHINTAPTGCEKQPMGADMNNRCKHNR